MSTYTPTAGDRVKRRGRGFQAGHPHFIPDGGTGVVMWVGVDKFEVRWDPEWVPKDWTDPFATYHVSDVYGFELIEDCPPDTWEDKLVLDP